MQPQTAGAAGVPLADWGNFSSYRGVCVGVVEKGVLVQKVNDLMQRDIAIAQDYLNGETLKGLSKIYGLSMERIRRVIHNVWLNHFRSKGSPRPFPSEVASWLQSERKRRKEITKS